MPNHNNIKSPVVLIAHGRSGTSLMMQIFKNHPEFDVVGETAPLVFGTWYAMQMEKGIVPPRLKDGQPVDFDERCANCVRNAFLTEFPSPKPRWMQKPIGVPFVYWNEKVKRVSDDDFAGWYWKVLTTSFPDARFVTILRDPRDVVLSSMQYWGSEERPVWDNIGLIAKILNAPENRICYAINYAKLVNSPESVLRALFDAIAVPYHSKVMISFDTVYVAQMGAGAQKAELFSDRISNSFRREHEWSKLNVSLLSTAHRAELIRLWKRFDEPFPMDA